MKALVIGASSGIGYAICEKLHSLGIIVYGASRNIDYEAGWTKVMLDVKSYMDVHDLASTQKNVTHIFNCAGYGLWGPFEDTPILDLIEQVSVNLLGTMYVCKYFIPVIIKNGGGMIFNFSSTSGVNGYPCEPVYCATKFGVEGLSESLYHELRPQGIQVKLIEPGPVDTSFGDNMVRIPFSDKYRELEEESQGDFEQLVANGFMQSPDEIADLVWDIIKEKDSDHFRYPTGDYAKRVAETRFRTVGPCVFV
jgi:short-subunit dehydrogenase